MQNGVKINIIEWDGETPLGGLELELVPDDGEPLGLALSPEEEAARIESLYAACIGWQSRPSDPHTCDSNFFAMLSSLRAVAKITQIPLATKAAACLAWLDTLWADYYTRKATGSTDYDFSSHGGCPHSFLEVRQEAGE